MNRTDQYIDDLKNCGLKCTGHRTAILGILDRSDQPATAEHVYFELKDRSISINLSTVYRVLDILAVNRLVNRLSISRDGRALYEYNRRVHRHYLICLGCRKIMPIEGCPLESYNRALEADTRYAITGHKLDIYGYCPQCRDNGRK